jgi:hypothetical protein
MLQIEALMVVTVEIAVFWDVMLYNPVDHCECLMCCFHLQP